MALDIPYFILPQRVRGDLERRAKLNGKAYRSFSLSLPFGYSIRWTISLEILDKDERDG
jgi:hypothetical protein